MSKSAIRLWLSLPLLLPLPLLLLLLLPPHHAPRPPPPPLLWTTSTLPLS